MYLITHTKRQWHRDICSNPVLHGFVLNLYLSGEEFPNHTDNYFPLGLVNTPELVAKMSRHLKEEDRHAALLRKIITKFEQPVSYLPAEFKYNHVIHQHTPVNFRINSHDDSDKKTEKLAHFLAHLHYLEKRVANSLQYHLEACCAGGLAYAEKALTTIVRDEIYHRNYTIQAVYDLMPRQKAVDILTTHYHAEKKADLDFSSQQVGYILQQYQHFFPAQRYLLYKLAGKLQQRILRHV